MEEDINMEAFKRINVIGTSGCGKSTFSKKLAQALNVPYLEIDKIFWGPDWTFLSDELLFEKLTTELSAPGWVLDGNYSRTTPVKWKNVQLVIWLDFSFTRVMFRIIKRTLSRAVTQTELWEGTNNRESIKNIFTGKSMITWSAQTFNDNRTKYNATMRDKEYQHIKFVRLTNPNEAKIFLKSAIKIHNS